MTRENKVALVVGFALVLFVGILISDHFSKARQQQPADLLGAAYAPASVENPTSLTDIAPPESIRFDLPVESDSTTTYATAPALPPAEPAVRRLVSHKTPSSAAAGDGRLHEVHVGESLELICRRYYGDVSLADKLAEYNGLADPDSVQAGRNLKIPDVAQLAGAEYARPESHAAHPGAYESYRIQPGDSLSELAQRFMSSAKRWRELYELNRDVISDPDRVRAGTVIRVPKGPKAT